MRAQIEMPGSLKEVLEIMASKAGACLVAGGTDLMPRMHRGLLQPPLLVLLEKVEELKVLRQEKDGLFIGAGVRLADLARSAEVKPYRAVIEAASRVATPQIRNQGTVGGNLLQENRCMYYNQSVSWRRELYPCFKLGGDRCYQYRNSPQCVALFQSDLAPALISYGAVAVIRSSVQQREIPLAELYLDAGKRALGHHEILVGVRLPAKHQPHLSAYEREALRGAFDFPTISCAIALDLSADQVVAGARVVMGAAGPYPRVVEEGEKILVGKKLAQLGEVAEELASASRKYIAPFRDTRVDGLVRRAQGQAVVQRALKTLA